MRVKRLQFNTRMLLALIVLVAVGLGGWRYWESTRPQRELASAIRDYSGLTDEEKDALCAVVWGKSGLDTESDGWIYGAWQRIGHLNGSRFRDFEWSQVRFRFERDGIRLDGLLSPRLASHTAYARMGKVQSPQSAERPEMLQIVIGNRCPFEIKLLKIPKRCEVGEANACDIRVCEHESLDVWQFRQLDQAVV